LNSLFAVMPEIEPGIPSVQDVQVMPTTDIHPHTRRAYDVVEWRVEPVIGSGQVALTLYVDGLHEVSFVLNAMDCGDLSGVLSHYGMGQQDTQVEHFN